MTAKTVYPLYDFLVGKGEMEFGDFVFQARAQGLRPENWLNEKNSGKLKTEILPDGRHVIRAVTQS